MDLKINDPELGKLTIKNTKDRIKLLKSIKARRSEVDNSKLGQRTVNKLIDKKKGRKYLVATY